MVRFILTKLGGMCIVMLLVASIVFVISRVIPGDPAGVMLGAAATPEDVARLREAYGLNEPILTQYVAWLIQILHFDFGQSIFLGQPVATAILQRGELTVTLCIFANLLTAVIGVPLGILAALYRGRWLDQVGTTIALLGASIPTFWVGLVLIRYFATYLGWFPVSGWGGPDTSWGERLHHLVLPAFAMSLPNAALILRITRTSMLEVLSQDYIRTARAKGLSAWSVILKHALRNALVPLVTVIGLSVAILIGGTALTETVFGLPGIGSLVVAAVLRRDYPVIQGALIVISGIYVIINLTTDLLYTVIDPRLRRGQA